VFLSKHGEDIEVKPDACVGIVHDTNTPLTSATSASLATNLRALHLDLSRL
jgi:hypothetical protein